MIKVFKKQRFNIYKIIGLTIFGLLLIWFTLNLTGLKFGNTVLVESCFIGEPIDILFGRMGWQSYLLLSAFFIGIALILFLTDKRTFLAKRINDSMDKV